MRLKIILVFFVFCGFSGVQDGHAGKAQYYSSYHNDYGIQLFEREKLNLAADRFLRSLLLNPTNDTAKEYLKKIIQKDFSMEKYTRNQLLRFLNLIEYYQFLHARIDAVYINNQKFLSFILRDSLENKDIRQIARSLQDEFTKEACQKRTFLLRFDTQILNGDVDLTSVNQEISDKRENMNAFLDYLQEVNTRLRALKLRVVKKKHARTMILKNYALKEKLNKVQSQMKQKEEMLSQQEKNNFDFHEQLTAVQMDYEFLQAKRADTDKYIVDLKRDMAGMSLELFEKNKIIDDQKEQISTLETAFLEARERFNLVQRIIQEKDARISVLETEMKINSESVASSVDSDIDSLHDLKAELEELQVDLERQSVSSFEKIVALEQKVYALTEKHVATQKEVVQKNYQIKGLKEIVSKNATKLLKYKKVFSSKDQKLMELNGIVEIYQGKLADVYSALKERNYELRSLEQKMDNLLHLGNPEERQPQKDSVEPTQADEIELLTDSVVPEGELDPALWRKFGKTSR